ncbi:hypothetical protein EVAR_52205_1 [Eumeta japonica]|uniref:Uncharacterized protein n=1 Tax=Eumeta variegata TaxID=151549 RepID=A0A4C1Z057_EUMVA|nr:hypothetical protein EVAR_52205_1 [Eumeta japonica]
MKVGICWGYATEFHLQTNRLIETNLGTVGMLRRHEQDVVGTVLIERSSGGQHLAAFQTFEDSTDSRH